MTTTTAQQTPAVTRVDQVLVIVGDVIVRNRQELKDGVIKALEWIAERDPAADPVSGVVVDLSAAKHLDSSAIAALVSGAVRCRESGRELVIAHATPEFRDVLERLQAPSQGITFTFAEDLPR